jgi:cytochrome c
MVRRHRYFTVILAFTTLPVASVCMANEALAKKNDCFACHSVANKLVGPAYRDVASKYTGQAGAEDQLVHSIREGSSGKWGDIPMPAHPKLSEADAHRLAKWILSGAK